MTSSSNNQPVGFFDSGVGGLTVLEAFLETTDHLSYHYLADTAHCPYGDRPLEEVRDFALAATGSLVEAGCKTVVMACNISSSVALEPARSRYPDVTIHGLINQNLARAVAGQSKSDRVGVLATSGTVKSNRYSELLNDYDLKVIQQACSPLVPLVESGQLKGPIVEQTLRPLLQPLLDADVDTVVLGCTHYPFLIPALKKLLPDQVKIVDPGRVLADRAAPEFKTNGKRSAGKFWATGEQESLYSLVPCLPTVEINEIQPADLESPALSV